MTTPCRPTTRSVDVSGTRVVVDVWEPMSPSGGDIVLVHGGAAHRGWWRPVAALLSRRHRVVCMDLSGHGDSDRRASYDLPQWTEEVTAVASTCCQGRPVVVGHSMGGLVVGHMAASAAEGLLGVVAIDAPVRPRSPELLARRRRAAAARPRVWPSQEAAADSFSPVPPAGVHAGPLVREVALGSFRETDDGWVTKLDPRVFLRSDPTAALLAEVRVPTIWVRCEDGLIDDDHAAELRIALEGRGLLVELPGAGHHVILDEPLACAWLVESVVAHLQRS